jgi:hypothetical protein
MSDTRGRGLVYPLLVAACLAAASLAAFQGVVTARYGTYSTLAAMLDKGEAVSPAALASDAQKAARLPNTCRTDLLNAAITIMLRNAEQVHESRDQLAWVEALRGLEPQLRQALACVPTDGMLWQRMAVVRWFLGCSADEEARLLAQSQAYAPGELEVVSARMLQWKRVTPAVIEGARDALRADIRVTLGHAKPPAVEAMLRELPATLQSLAGQEVAALPPERTKDLLQAGIRLP